MKHPVLIKFGDNDFHGTFIPILRMLKESNFDGSKEQLLNIINGISYSFYCIHALRWHTHGEDPKKDQSTQDYLMLEERHLYYGRDEVDAFFQDSEKMDQCNLDCWYFYPKMDGIGML